MPVHITNPLSESRWEDLVARHPRSSVFHQKGWMEALLRTYGYEPLVLTSSPAGEPLQNGVLFCRVSSWLTGKRLVSLPFSDHCDPLFENSEEYDVITSWLQAERARENLKYVELRPLSAAPLEETGFGSSHQYWLHKLNLNNSLEDIFKHFHKDSIQRKIRRAEREKLSCDFGRSEQLVQDFYRLLLITRRRHHLPPQPRKWFLNLAECMGPKMQILVARKDGIAVAAMLVLSHRTSVVYKYGCSNDKFHHLGGMPFLFWKLIEQRKAAGMEEIDFGRSDLDQESLITFKNRFGARGQLLTYYRYPDVKREEIAEHKAFRRFLSILPDTVLSATGRLLYRHIG